MNQTFEQYSDQKIKDFENLKSFFPEYFRGDFSYFEEELPIASHMNDTKKALEHILQRDLTWREVDYYSGIFMGIATAHIAKLINEGTLEQPRNLEDIINLDVLMRKRFCELLLIKMLDEDLYSNLCRVNHTRATKANIVG
jgi:hypothetical protein